MPRTFTLHHTDRYGLTLEHATLTAPDLDTAIQRLEARARREDTDLPFLVTVRPEHRQTPGVWSTAFDTFTLREHGAGRTRPEQP